MFEVILDQLLVLSPFLRLLTVLIYVKFEEAHDRAHSALVKPTTMHSQVCNASVGY